MTAALTQLSQTTYPLSVLLERPLPEGVDPTKLEFYLAETDYEAALGMNKTDFMELPVWKKTKLKKDHGLF